MDTGRSFLWRLGRKLYCTARHDGPNVPEMNGEYELVRRVLTAGIARTFVDVGANRGDWAATVAATARRVGVALDGIVVVEPNPALARICRERFAPLSKVEVVGVALSDRCGRATFFVAKGSGGTSSLWQPPSEICEQIVVETTTFDHLFETRMETAFGLVKIDAEGSDFAILQGMEKHLSKHAIDIVQFEYNIRWRAARAYLHDAWEFAARVGYAFGKVTPWGPILFRSWNDELERFFEANYLIMKVSIAKQIGARWGDWRTDNTVALA